MMVREMENFDQIRYLVIDVDGTLTDAGIYYDEHGNELKKFCTKDAAGFFAAHQAGIKILVLTGRECAATTKRMKEMRVEYLVQDCKDKVQYLKTFMRENHIGKEEIGYLGDDLNDLPGMRLCGFIGCPADACEEVKDKADYISDAKGGYGAVRDIIAYILKQRGDWEEAVSRVYGIGI